MIFEHKILLFFLLTVPVFILLGFLGAKLKQKRLNIFINSGLANYLIPINSKKKQALKFWLKILSITFFLVALTGPKFGKKIVEVKKRGLDVIIAIDTSLSMLAEDIKPNRLTQAKSELSRIANSLAGNRLGIIAFAGTSILQCPLTTDINAVKLFLDFVDINSVPEQGTNLGDVIALARETFDKKEQKYKVLIILTDGEDHESNVLSEMEMAKKEGVKIFTIGFGNISGEIIPIRDKSGKIVDYKKDIRGATVTSKLDESLLKKIANSTGGKYYYSRNGLLDVEIISKDLEAFEKKELNSKMSEQYEEKFYYFLFLGFLILVLESFIKETSEKRA